MYMVDKNNRFAIMYKCPWETIRSRSSSSSISSVLDLDRNLNLASILISSINITAQNFVYMFMS